MLLITDLDNTLYDWVSFYAQSFKAMLSELAKLLDQPEAALIQEFKSVHQYYGNSEQVFAILDLPSVRARFGKASGTELLKHLEQPLRAFNVSRKQHLKLYEGVEKTLSILKSEVITVVGHTEATAQNSFYRLRKLDVERYFSRLYTVEGTFQAHPDPEGAKEFEPPLGFVKLVSWADRKPNPSLLLDICAKEATDPGDAWYIGDSIVKDIGMALEAGVKAVWARYGTNYDRRHWDTLVSITHWTEKDVLNESQLRGRYRDVKPDFIVDSFSELLDIMPLASTRNLVPASSRIERGVASTV